MPAPTLSLPAQELRRLDRERFVTALFAPHHRRDDLMVLYAFSALVAAAPASVRDPLAGALRLQWWRDVVQGDRPSDEVRAHPVAGRLGELVAARILPKDLLTPLIDARDFDLGSAPFADLGEMERYAEAVGGALTEAAMRVLGVGSAEIHATGRSAGTAVGLSHLLRSTAGEAARARALLPEAELVRAGSSAEALAAGRAERPAVAQAAQVIGARAEALLEQARAGARSRQGLAALLPATIASNTLKRLQKVGWDVFDPRVAPPAPPVARLAVNSMLGRF